MSSFYFLRWTRRIVSDPCLLLRGWVVFAKPLCPEMHGLRLRALASFAQHQGVVVQHNRQCDRIVLQLCRGVIISSGKGLGIGFRRQLVSLLSLVQSGQFKKPHAVGSCRKPSPKPFFPAPRSASLSSSVPLLAPVKIPNRFCFVRSNSLLFAPKFLLSTFRFLSRVSDRRSR
jgi:hypothetical protein